MSDAFAHARAPWVDSGVDAALARLDRALRSEAELSFDVVGSSPESMLMQALVRTQQLSFAAGTDETAREEAEARDAGALLDDLLARAQTAIRVETSRDDHVLATTVINLGGRTHNRVAATATADDLLRHREALAVELRARAARLRMLSAVLQAATRIAIASGTGNPLLALRAAWRFVSDVMTEHARQTSTN